MTNNYNQGNYGVYQSQSSYPYRYPYQYGQQQQVPQPTSAPTTGPQVPDMLPLEESYIENILRLNKGKVATVYMTFENGREGRTQIFKGMIEAAGRDHIILSDTESEKRYVLLMVYLDYITFDEEIEYYPDRIVSYSPR
ncbi:spore coat protein GerQ [Cytobacillus sp. IB215665]|uniref:spore coat protein GerQ n=1 Tax=Cytobacillus sp. IB215665 TaxID=3097357 RepID=UPI002A0E5EB3|nr:spore coat protein GerQ [Cytobacillus sp. IB215665]MDX8363640.1 spore coat protein GerQ [Cytobacillus sp. IB215665]